MNYLTLPIIKNTLKRKQAIICIGFAVYPLLLIVTSMIDTRFMQFGGEAGAISCIEFFSAVEYSQFQLTLPILAFLYLIHTSFYEENHNGTLFLYKDIQRSKLLNAKIFAILIVYFIYFVSTFVASVITYYVTVIHMPVASHTFFPKDHETLIYVLISILGIFLMYCIDLLFGIMLSMKYSAGLTLIAGLLLTFTSFIAPMLNSVKYIFPTSYASMMKDFSNLTIILIQLFLFLAYISAFYLMSLYKFKKLEY